MTRMCCRTTKVDLEMVPMAAFAPAEPRLQASRTRLAPFRP
jgi:hypothetical protein